MLKISPIMSTFFSSVVVRCTFFDRCQIPPEVLARKQQEWLEQIAKETDAHCAYLTSIGLGDRAVILKLNLSSIKILNQKQ
jgi:hypothetical protein